MKKQINVLKLTGLAVFVAAFGVGCASSGHARYDGDAYDANDGVGVSAGAEVGADADVDADVDTDLDDADVDVDSDLDLGMKSGTVKDSGSTTVSALSFTAVTDPVQRTKWMFDPTVQLRSIETYTFAVPDPGLQVSTDDLPEFSVNLPPGSVYVEAAGGAGEARAGRVVQHSPNPR